MIYAVSSPLYHEFLSVKPASKSGFSNGPTDMGLKQKGSDGKYQGE
jgi:hypothetical protein